MDANQKKGIKILNSCRFNFKDSSNLTCYYKNVVIEDYNKYLDVNVYINNLYYMDNKFMWKKYIINNNIKLNDLLEKIKSLHDINLYFQGITNDTENNYYVRIGR